MRIAGAQFSALQAPLEREFEARMQAHVAQHFPDQARQLGSKGLPAHVSAGIRRARETGLVSERDICLFLHLWTVLGPDFETNPQLPWVRAFYADPNLNHPVHRLHRLYEFAESRLKVR